MWLDDYTWPDEWGEWWTQSSEVSEVFKEAVKKASSGMKRTQKDEGKARGYDMLLANFLIELILDKKYDNLLHLLFLSLKKGYPSNFLLWIMSVVYIDISHKIREVSLKPTIEYSYKSPSPIEFDDSKLDPQVKDRINQWVEDMVDSVSVEYSSILTARLLGLLKTDETIVDFIWIVFTFFLKESNIVIWSSWSESIVSFILQEVYKTIKSLNLEEI